MINLQLSVDQVNALLAILGKQPYEQVSMLVAEILQQGAPQAKALEDAAKTEQPCGTGLKQSLRRPVQWPLLFLART